MRNKLGDDGVINIDGKIGSVAEILDISDPEFFDSIETGIKSTVRVLINNGFKTYSSCQGHYDASFSLRNVVVVLESFEVDFWRAMIAEINILNKFQEPITYLLVDYKDGKKGLMIIFGSVFQLDEVEKKQKCFENVIPNLKQYYYGKKNDDIVDFTDRCGHINVFLDNN